MITARFKAGVAGVNSGDVLLTLDNAEAFNYFTVAGLAGAADVQVSLDGTNWLSTVLALVDENSTTPGTRVVVTAANRTYSFQGNYRRVRVRQSGGTAATGYVLAYGRS